MRTVVDLEQFFDAHILGRPYYADDDSRLGPVHYDCSGATWACMVHGAGLSANVVPTTSYYQAAWLRRAGQLHCGPAGVEQGLHSRGWLMLRGPDCGLLGYGNLGHVALSDGSGGGIREAQGRRNGCVHDRAFPGEFVAAGPIPGIDYGGGPIPAPPGPPNNWLAVISWALHERRDRFNDVAKIGHDLHIGQRDGRGQIEVKLWQNALNWALNSQGSGRLAVDGDFGVRTRFATAVLQEHAHRADVPINGVAYLRTRQVAQYFLALQGMAAA